MWLTHLFLQHSFKKLNVSYLSAITYIYHWHIFCNHQWWPVFGCFILLNDFFFISFSGGEGKPGKVKDIRGWDSESGRSVANVIWSNSQMNVYRVGHKGKVDLKAIQVASGGMFYRDHLPVLGKLLPRIRWNSVSF